MTLLFLHGAGFTGSCFAGQLRDFPSAHAPDLPGRNGSPVRASIDDYAEWTEEYAAAQRIDQPVLCGHSMGAAVALAVALRARLALCGLVLLGGGARLRVAPAIFDALETDFEKGARILAQLFFSQPTADRVEWAVGTMLRVGREQTLNDFRACDAFDILDRLGSINPRLLAMTGEQDQLTPPKYAHAVADRVRHGQARILPGAGHFMMVEQPAETNHALRAFLRKLPEHV